MRDRSLLARPVGATVFGVPVPAGPAVLTQRQRVLAKTVKKHAAEDPCFNGVRLGFLKALMESASTV